MQILRGIRIFKEFFKNYEDDYCIIGGTALVATMSVKGLKSRKTNDIDLLVFINSNSDEFIQRLIEFVRGGDYHGKYCSSNFCSYRFNKPGKGEYPELI